MTEKTIIVRNIKTNFVELGKSNAKKTIIFLHGWGGSSESFFELVSKFSRENFFRIIIPDLPGFGKSEMPPKNGWTTQDYEIWFQEFARKLNLKKYVLIGHSFGCRVIIRHLLQKNQAEKVVIMGGAGIKWQPTFREKISLYLSKKFSLAKKLIPQKIQKIIITKIFGARDWGMVNKNLKTTLKKVLDESDFREKLLTIKTPTLLIWGKNDTCTPLKSGEIFHKNLANSRLIIFPDGRHGIHRTHANKISKLIREFLQSV